MGKRRKKIIFNNNVKSREKSCEIANQRYCKTLGLKKDRLALNLKIKYIEFKTEGLTKSLTGKEKCQIQHRIPKDSNRLDD